MGSLADELSGLLRNDDLVDADGLVEMADIRPALTGLRFWVHAYKNIDRRARHGPRLKVYQGARPPQDDISISIPTKAGTEPEVKAGRVVVSAAELATIFRFIMQNRAVLIRYWEDPEYAGDQMYADMKRV